MANTAKPLVNKPLLAKKAPAKVIVKAAVPVKKTSPAKMQAAPVKKSAAKGSVKGKKIVAPISKSLTKDKKLQKKSQKTIIKSLQNRAKKVEKSTSPTHTFKKAPEKKGKPHPRKGLKMALKGKSNHGRVGKKLDYSK